MRYRTVIEVVTEARDKSEAIEIVGDYLSGDVLSGVKMKYSTSAANGIKKAVITITALSLMLVGGMISMYLTKPIGSGAPSAAGMSAVQPPLQTQVIHIRDAQFKAQWQDEHNKEALRKIKLTQ